MLSCDFSGTKKSGYRLVGKDGKVIYFEKKRPQFNEEQIKKQAKEKVKKSKKVGGDEAAEKSTVSEEEKEKMLLDSSAYSLKSVMDNMVKNEDMSALARKIEVSQSKTIKDFEFIPDGYFENFSDGESLTIRQNDKFNQSKKIEKRRDIDELKVESSTTLEKNKYYLQLGSFKSREKAKRLLERSRSMGGTAWKIVESRRKGLPFYRVVMGTYNTKSEATNAMEKLIAGGHTDVFIFKN
jgi:hypothetical protein